MSVKAASNDISAISNSLAASLVSKEGSTTVIDDNNKLIYGLFQGISEAEFTADSIQVVGDGFAKIEKPSGAFATGTKVKLCNSNTNEVLDTYDIIIFGDITGDANINGIDAGKAIDFENYLFSWDPVTDKALYRAGDLNGDGNVNSIDAGIMINSENYMETIDQTAGTVITKTYSVVFKDYNGTVISSNTVEEGGDAPLPLNPVRAGYVFAGWSGDYRNVTSNRDITPIYIISNASNIFSVSSSNGNTGDTVTLLVTLGGTVKTCGFDLRMKYDNSALEFVSLNTDLGLDVVANHIASTNEIAFNFGAAQNKTVTKKVIEVTFRVLDTVVTDTVVELSAIEVIFIDPNQNNLPKPVEYNLADGVVFINQ